MKGGEACYTECDADINQEILIKCQEYKATQDVSLKICCDSEDQCTYETGKKTEKGDFRQWYQAAVKCPAGTKKVWSHVVHLCSTLFLYCTCFLYLV